MLARPAPLHRGLPDHGARDRVEARLRLHPRRVPGPSSRCSATRSRRCARRELLGGVTIVLHRGAGAYICGEETALLESLEGKRGQPRSKPPFPAIAGLYASPTLVNNVETIATVPPIIEIGGEEYAKLGVRRTRPGRASSRSPATSSTAATTSCRSGITLRELIYDLGGGIPDGRELKAVIPGGSSMPVLTADEIDVPLDYDSLAELGTMLGSARDDRDRRPLLHGAARPPRRAVLQHESCGKCTPCREGTRWMVQILRRDRGRRGAAGRARPAARRLRPDPRQVPLPARRRRRDAGGELRRQVPRRVPGAHRRRLPVRRRRRRSTPSSRRSTSTRTRRRRGGARRERHRAEHVNSRSTGARSRCRRAPGSSRRPQPRHRDPGLLLRAAARAGRRRLPDVPRRDRGDARSCRPAAR